MVVNPRATRLGKPAANDGRDIAPKSKEIVIAVVGYAGAGCTEVARQLQLSLDKKNYKAEIVKLSDVIIQSITNRSEIPIKSQKAADKGIASLSRAGYLQNKGDELRSHHGNDILIRKAFAEFEPLRGGAQAGTSKIAFIIDSIKHVGEVNLLRKLYGPSFRLVSVHCSKNRRKERLFGAVTSSAKFSGADVSEVEKFMERDEKDATNKKTGQQVRDAFYLGDYFLDNENDDPQRSALIDDIDRFTDLLLGMRLFRPRREESGIYQAFAAARHSSCLSRQVGAALYSQEGRLIADGANEVPKFGGGVYGEDDDIPERRCFAWDFSSNGIDFKGCHNTRKKVEIRGRIADWLKGDFTNDMIGRLVVSEYLKADHADRFAELLRKGIEISEEKLEDAPGIGELIEFSRSIHAEMDAVFTAARAGYSTSGTTLFCTTYSCHNCARHMVTAGVEKIVYVEPYVKSLALELHSDSITDQLTETVNEDGIKHKLLIKAFTGVGPRMFDIHFKKSIELKNDDGTYKEPSGGVPVEALSIERLEENLKHVTSDKDENYV